jgi:hypothetical protein
METIGSIAPTLEVYLCTNGDKSACNSPTYPNNNNCIHSYTQFIQVAESVNECKVSTPPITPPTEASTITPTPATKTGQCPGNAIKFTDDNRLLPLPNQNSCARTVTGACGRPGTCAVPAKIVLHITVNDIDAAATFQFFAGGGAGAGTGSHFIIGKDGHILQAVEMLENQIEIAYAVAGYTDHISIEMVSRPVYHSKAEVPQAQYQATLNLVKALMTQYNIPLGNLEYTYKSNTDAFNPQITAGVYGHYQLNPGTKTDPGEGLMRDIREDLKP